MLTLRTLKVLPHRALSVIPGAASGLDLSLGQELSCPLCLALGLGVGLSAQWVPFRAKLRVRVL